jgi:hypothetical protein
MLIEVSPAIKRQNVRNKPPHHGIMTVQWLTIDVSQLARIDYVCPGGDREMVCTLPQLSSRCCSEPGTEKLLGYPGDYRRPYLL